MNISFIIIYKHQAIHSPHLIDKAYNLRFIKVIGGSVNDLTVNYHLHMGKNQKEYHHFQ